MVMLTAAGVVTFVVFPPQDGVVMISDKYIVNAYIIGTIL